MLIYGNVSFHVLPQGYNSHRSIKWNGPSVAFPGQMKRAASSKDKEMTDLSCQVFSTEFKPFVSNMAWSQPHCSAGEWREKKRKKKGFMEEGLMNIPCIACTCWSYRKRGWCFSTQRKKNFQVLLYLKRRKNSLQDADVISTPHKHACSAHQLL